MADGWGIIRAEVTEMKAKSIVGTLGMLFLVLAVPLSVVAAEATVTLAITGMT